jgi:hypothetical protein
MSFSQKLLTASFTLGSGNFGSGGNSLTLSNLRMTCDITLVQADAQPKLDNLTIYGMTLDHMNQLSQTGATYNRLSQHNTVTVQAGDAESGMSTVFSGDILSAVPDGSDQPNFRFMVTAVPTGFAARKPVAPTTRKGAVAGEDLLSALASQMGLGFENNGVHVMLRNPYLHGTAVSQVRQCVDSVGCQWMVDRGTLAIWPTGKARSGGPVTVSPTSNPRMVGYPQGDQAQVVLTTEYSPAIKPGGQVTIQSSLTMACGTWNIGQMKYELDALVPHGRWFMTMICLNPSGPGLASGVTP